MARPETVGDRSRGRWRGPGAGARCGLRRAALAAGLAGWALVAAAAGCAGRRPAPALPWPSAGAADSTAAGRGAAPATAASPLPAAARGGYEALRESLAERDLTPLRGRRIVLDPGHGGAFRGARGPNGIEEADVNLGVALHLRGLLEWAGAVVIMTRTADVDLLTPADSSVAADLRARVAIADSARAGVFLSLHHNSNAARDTTQNETQTYYPLGRDGADLDLARAIHRHLVANLEVGAGRILPGNFRVLRDSRVPAVLGEPAMLTHPEVARRLSLAAKQELEAQAYFLGLLDYFAGGAPRWLPLPEGPPPPDPALAPPPRWRFDPGGEPGRPGPGLDPASVALAVDGRREPVEVSADGATVTWRAASPWPAGEHRLELRGRNLAGRATPVSERAWRAPPRPERFTSELWFAATAAGTPDSTAPALLAWECRDDAGQPCAAMGALSLAGDRDGAPPRPLPAWPGSRGWHLLPWRAWPGEARLQRALRDGRAEDHRLDPLRHALPPGTRFVLLGAPGWQPAAVVPGGGWRARLPAAPEEPALPSSWPVLALRRGQPFWVEADGARPLYGDERHGGPWDPAAAPVDTLVWRPLLPELIGRCVVLDPAGGGADTDGAGPLGTRGADLNLAVAEALAQLLRGAGARVVLAREDERWVAPEAKLLLADEAAADLFLTVSRGAPGGPRRAAFYSEGSRAGARWARAYARAAATLAAGDSLPVVPAAEYLLRQTACPALRAALEPPADADTEQRLLLPAHQQAEARALLLAAAGALAGEEAAAAPLDPAALIAAVPQAFPPPANIVWAQLDGNWPWLPPLWSAAPGARATWQAAPGLPARGDEHVLEVRTGRQWRLVALRREGPGRWRAAVVFQGDAAPAAAPSGASG